MRMISFEAWRRSVLTVLTAALVAAFLISLGSAEAAPGGQGKGKGQGQGGGNGGGDTSTGSTASLTVQSGSAELTASEGSVDGTVTLSANGESYVINGSGFEPNSIVYIGIHEPTCCAATSVGTDANGNFWFSRSTEGPGTYTVNASVLKRNKVVLVASISFAVVEQ